MDSSTANLQASYCHYLWHSATVLCDGRVTCGLDDAHGRFCLGNIEEQSLSEIWSGHRSEMRRWRLISGELCMHCKLSTRISEIVDRQLVLPDTPLPRRLILEPTILCNLRCINGTCQAVYSSPGFRRGRQMMPWDSYARLMMQAAPHLDELHFYNYGESFLHPQAAEMLEYAKRIKPSLRIYTSTNAIRLSRPGLAERVAPLIDSMVFTISGVDRRAYKRYHSFDRFDEAMLGMRLMANAAGALEKRPRLMWRYILFNWNDSGEELIQARALAREIGVELIFILTADPLYGVSSLRAPGAPGHTAVQDAAECYFGYEPRLFEQEGLYPVEYSDAGLYCWIGKSARLVFRCPVKKLNLRLRADSGKGADRPHVRIRTELETIDASVGTTTWSDNFLEVPITENSRFVVEIDSDRTWCPMAAGLGNDERQLSVALAVDEWRDADCIHAAWCSHS